jgi:group I intron endonuclease
MNLETDKAYIGQTRESLVVRFRQHCEPNKTSKSIISQSIQKYGKDAFYMEALWESPGCSQEQLDSKEIELIRIYNTQSPNGYNITAGGRGMAAPSEETRRKMSSSARKKFIDHPDLRDELSRLRSSERHSEERRLRHSETMKQKYKNDEKFREKMKLSRAGVHASEIGIKNRKNGLIKFNQEHPERFRKIYMFDTERILTHIFDKLADAERSGLNRGSIVRCIKSGQMFKKSMYFSYSSTLPFVPT